METTIINIKFDNKLARKAAKQKAKEKLIRIMCQFITITIMILFICFLFVVAMR